MSVSYTRVNFKNRVVERPRTYTKTTNADNSVTLTPAFGEVEEAGVPLNAENLNKMDKGVSDCAAAINALEEDVTQLGQSVQSAEQDIQDLKQDLAEDEAAIGDNAREINALKTRADTAEGNILTLAQNDAAVARDLTAKQAAIEENASQINQLKTRVDTAETNINKKQDKLTFDSAPTAGSNNPVTSKGIKAALDAKQGTLAFDSTPTSGSGNPVTSGGLYSALAGKKNTQTAKSSPAASGNALAFIDTVSQNAQGVITATKKNVTVDSMPTADSNNPVTSGGVKTELNKKQDNLTFDSTPTAGSTNPVTSGGVKAALDAKVVTFTASIPATGWTSQSSGAYYTRNVTLTGILATDTPDISIVQTGTWATDEAIRDAWACITRIVTAANKLTITADSIPSRAIPIQVRCIR